MEKKLTEYFGAQNRCSNMEMTEVLGEGCPEGGISSKYDTLTDTFLRKSPELNENDNKSHKIMGLGVLGRIPHTEEGNPESIIKIEQKEYAYELDKEAEPILLAHVDSSNGNSAECGSGENGNKCDSHTFPISSAHKSIPEILVIGNGDRKAECEPKDLLVFRKRFQTERISVDLTKDEEVQSNDIAMDMDIYTDTPTQEIKPQSTRLGRNENIEIIEIDTNEVKPIDADEYQKKSCHGTVIHEKNTKTLKAPEQKAKKRVGRPPKSASLKKKESINKLNFYPSRSVTNGEKVSPEQRENGEVMSNEQVGVAGVQEPEAETYKIKKIRLKLNVAEVSKINIDPLKKGKVPVMFLGRDKASFVTGRKKKKDIAEMKVMNEVDRFRFRQMMEREINKELEAPWPGKVFGRNEHYKGEIQTGFACERPSDCGDSKGKWGKVEKAIDPLCNELTRMFHYDTTQLNTKDQGSRRYGKDDWESTKNDVIAFFRRQLGKNAFKVEDLRVGDWEQLWKMEPKGCNKRVISAILEKQKLTAKPSDHGSFCDAGGEKSSSLSRYTQLLLTQKYAPNNSDEIVGNEKFVRDIMDWLNAYDLMSKMKSDDKKHNGESKRKLDLELREKRIMMKRDGFSNQEISFFLENMVSTEQLKNKIRTRGDCKRRNMKIGYNVTSNNSNSSNSNSNSNSDGDDSHLDLAGRSFSQYHYLTPESTGSRTSVMGRSGRKKKHNINKITIIIGPPSSGKTAAVKAIAKQMGYIIHEINVGTLGNDSGDGNSSSQGAVDYAKMLRRKLMNIVKGSEMVNNNRIIALIDQDDENIINKSGGNNGILQILEQIISENKTRIPIIITRSEKKKPRNKLYGFCGMPGAALPLSCGNTDARVDLSITGRTAEFQRHIKTIEFVPPKTDVLSRYLSLVIASESGQNFNNEASCQNGKECVGVNKDTDIDMDIDMDPGIGPNPVVIEDGQTSVSLDFGKVNEPNDNTSKTFNFVRKMLYHKVETAAIAENHCDAGEYYINGELNENLLLQEKILTLPKIHGYEDGQDGHEFVAQCDYC
ncbi:hypothetical protein AX774_g5188 [Zancudomyces culisetae]|uniref:ATPase AAA-type core domain-containing protein n=1 Tax=Zancudomyces culisetae TaxID=1213189 RepID=A0A1R1PKA6_ZANCU|nr:hypothetical protein AX774_g5188 [Zancudomyces culisetae]|eukprot:OMH81353.1 hypothetical protein AX774_g5188 [Zancudomyces culisetae]